MSENTSDILSPHPPQRRIRRTKREVEALNAALDNADAATRPALESDYAQKALALQKQNSEYNRFCEEHNLTPLRDRLNIAGWDRSQAAKATGAAERVLSLDDESQRLLRLDVSRRARFTKHPELALPNASSAIADSKKFTGYLFNPDNPKGFAKGRAFTKRLGYDASNWEDLRAEILNNAGMYPALKKELTLYGQKYEQKQILRGLKGRPANVVVGWLLENEDPKMTTAYIKEV